MAQQYKGSTASDVVESKTFMLRNPKVKSKFIFGELPRDVIDIIDQKVIDARSIDFCDRLLSIVPKANMRSEEFLQKCSEFIKRIHTFIERISFGDVNPAQLAQSNSCLFFVESQCLIVLREMMLHFVDHGDEDEVSDLLILEVDELRDIIIYLFAENRINVNKIMLEDVLDVSKVSLILKSVEWIVTMCFCVLKANMNILTADSFEKHALTILEECSDILITILNNQRISVDLKKKTMDVFTYMMTRMFSIFEQAQQHGYGSEVELLTYEKYKQLKIKYDEISKHLEKKYSPGRKGGRSQKLSKNKLNHYTPKRKNKSNSIRKNNKNIKKTLRLRNNK